MDLSALRPDERVMLSRNERRALGERKHVQLGCADTVEQLALLLAVLQVLAQGGQMKEVRVEYSRSLGRCSQLQLQSYGLDTLCKWRESEVGGLSCSETVQGMSAEIMHVLSLPPPACLCKRIIIRGVA